MRILIPLDGSKFAEAVLPAAVELAQSCGAEVHLLRVVGPEEGRVDWGTQLPGEGNYRGSGRAPRSRTVVVESQDEANQRVRGDALEYLERIGLEHLGPGTKKTAVTGEEVAEEILEYVAEAEISMIAMATHGRSGRERAMLGSVAGELLRSRKVPVYLVRPEGLSNEPA